MRPLTFLPALLLLSAAGARADDLLPADQPIEQAVDHYLDARLRDAGVTPAPPADDAAFLRRVTLDLVGRIPTAAEVQSYLASADADKKLRLIDRLMASSGFVRHQATEFDVLLMAGSRGSLRDYLTRAFAENRSWDRVFRELLLADESDPARKGAGEFLKQRVRDPDRLTNDVSSLFFGVNVSCAQCHDHPRVDDWKQDHFYGMKSFFDRTFDNGGFLAEREVGLVKFRTTKGQDRTARMMFLTGAAVDSPTVREPTRDEQRREKELFESFKRKKEAPPPPKFSARAQLVELALQPGQRDFFARAIVNRLFFRFFGQGLVMPLDQMHSANPPSHPELLDWLARDVAEHGYDLRRLIRGLVLSRAYGRTSRWPTDDPPRPALFAVAQVRPLRPAQLAVSLRLATAVPEQFPAELPAAEQEKRLEALENSARGLAGLFDQPSEDFQVGVAEALLFSNSDRLHQELLGDGRDRLVGRLKEINDVGEVVEVAVRAVLSRPPTDEERTALGNYLQRRADRPAEGRRQLVWALVSSPEFRFNH